MKRARAAAGLAAVWGLLAAGCGPAKDRRPEPPEPDLRIWVPTVLRWAPGEARAVRFAIENGTPRTLRVPEPDASLARVSIFAGAEAAQLCGVDPADAPAGDSIPLAPGDQVAVRVDLADACRDLRPGEYRYELGYRVPAAGGHGATALRTRYGTLVIEGTARAAGRASPAPHRSPESRVP